MSAVAAGSLAAEAIDAPPGGEGTAPEASADAALALASVAAGEGRRRVRLALDGLHCGGCVARVERELGALPGVDSARVNLTTRTASVTWRGAPPPLLAELEALGYPARPVSEAADTGDAALRGYLIDLGVAGFAAANLMGLSVAVWSGADAASTTLFHAVSALIGVPALAFSARRFFVSAWRALRRGHTNMDVPISVGVTLATAASLYDAAIGGGHVYFEASVTLVFFLLAGRTLDHVVRARARRAVEQLAKLQSPGAVVRDEDGRWRYRALREIAVGARLRIAPGERVPLDARVEEGRSEVDASLVTGESVPVAVTAGSRLQSGVLNLSGPLELRVTADVEGSFLAEITRSMLAAERGRGRYRRVADRAARLYAPFVHGAAAVGFVGWYLATGDAHRAVGIAVAVLIITCPCALGLAVPMAQVVATRRLFDAGILVKDGVALERLAEADHVVFDKTGTLTTDAPTLVAAPGYDAGGLALAARLARHASHPYSRAIVAAANRATAEVPPPADGATFGRTVGEGRPLDVEECPGAGVRARVDGTELRLGRERWALAGGGGDANGPPGRPSVDLDDRLRDDATGEMARDRDAGPADPAGVVLARDGVRLATFTFTDTPRDDAAAALDALRARGLEPELLSGDAPGPVGALAARLGLARWRARALPHDKLAHVEALGASGRRVLMVGDGINDAPALAAAHVSMAPGGAADVGRNAADLVFLRGELLATVRALDLARRTARVVRQNFAIALVYNAVALPLAFAGLVTPLIAALAMSSSSVLVVLNALRLGRAGANATRPPDRRAAPARTA